MRAVVATPDVEAWRRDARELLAEGVPPSEVVWGAPGETGLLFARPGGGPSRPGGGPSPSGGDANGSSTSRVPAGFIKIAGDVILHREPGAHALLYRALWRLTHGEPHLLDDAIDDDTRAMRLRAKQVHRAVHDMHAFVRFRTVHAAPADEPQYVAWYAPTHHIVRRAAPFFAERFSSMRWTIMTPDESVSWEGDQLVYGPGVPRSTAPTGDDIEELWTTYYASTFNPARANPKLMRQHLPRRYWPQLPESAAIPDLLAAASQRVSAMVDPASAIVSRLGDRIVRRQPSSLRVLAEAAATCAGCELCGPATQTVFGEGPVDARVALVGEQPGDEEDRAGRPFVGPSGRVLDAALDELGLDRRAMYVTNAVKHFRYVLEPRGTRRIHSKPTTYHVQACKPWLGAELRVIAPKVIVCLGSTAAHAIIGSRFRVSEERGRPVATHWAEHVVATHHPAAVLRCEPEDRPRYEAELRADLALAIRLALHTEAEVRDTVAP